MLTKTPYSIDVNLIERLLPDIFDNGKTDITEPTGDFFYDPWRLKEEFEGTVWEDVWCSLPVDTGQARVIVMDSPSCYTQHADIDDRYHLNIVSNRDFLIDLENQTMYPLHTDGVWYTMDAGKLHTAITVGETQRVQLVVRHLLKNNNLTDRQTVKIITKGAQPRYLFDNFLSPWLNRANKNGIIANFKTQQETVMFDIEKKSLNDLLHHLPHDFDIEVKT